MDNDEPLESETTGEKASHLSPPSMTHSGPLDPEPSRLGMTCCVAWLQNLPDRE